MLTMEAPVMQSVLPFPVLFCLVTLLFDVFVEALIRISKTWLVHWLVSVQFDWRERKRPVNPLWRPHHRVEGVYELFSLIVWCLIWGRRAFKAGQMYPVASVRDSKCLIFLQFQGILRANFIRYTHSFKEESNILFVKKRAQRSSMGKKIW